MSINATRFWHSQSFTISSLQGRSSVWWEHLQPPQRVIPGICQKGWIESKPLFQWEHYDIFLSVIYPFRQTIWMDEWWLIEFQHGSRRAKYIRKCHSKLTSKFICLPLTTNPTVGKQEQSNKKRGRGLQQQQQFNHNVIFTKVHSGHRSLLLYNGNNDTFTATTKTSKHAKAGAANKYQSTPPSLLPSSERFRPCFHWQLRRSISSSTATTSIFT